QPEAIPHLQIDLPWFGIVRTPERGAVVQQEPPIPQIEGSDRERQTLRHGLSQCKIERIVRLQMRRHVAGPVREPAAVRPAAARESPPRKTGIESRVECVALVMIQPEVTAGWRRKIRQASADGSLAFGMGQRIGHIYLGAPSNPG